MRAAPLGQDAVRIECADAAEARALARIARREVPEALDVVPAARSLVIDGVSDPEAVCAMARQWQPSAPESSASRLVEIPTTYDGPDLADVAEHWGLSVEETIARHRDIEYVVAFCGFAPGFAYCAGLPPEYAVPRLDRPRSRVPAGSVAIADTWTAVYPTASPGGWRLLGTTDLRLWDADADPPALLTPGTTVRFRDTRSFGSATRGLRDA